MKAILVYQSSTGFTKRYAQWISEALQCEAVPLKEAQTMDFSQYHQMIYGGPIHGGMIGGFKKAKNIVSKNPNLSLIAFGVGAAPINDETTNVLAKANLTPEEKTPMFYMPGGLNYGKMGIGSRIIMGIFAFAMKRKKDKTPEEEGMAQALGNTYDISDKASIQPLVGYVLGSLAP